MSSIYKLPTVGAQVSRCLAAFDFDYTVVAQNTDAVVRDMLSPDKCPNDSLVESSGWTEYMAEVFRRLHKQRVTPAQLRDMIRAIPEVPGFARLLKRLNQCTNPKYDMIIISDSNSVFIADWLEAHGLSGCFERIFTNPAEFDEQGLLHIRPYHHQTDCKLSAPNLCKGKVLEHFMIEQNLRYNIRYERVIYVGDGNNDLCPVLKLRCGDIACARRGYALDKKLDKKRDKMPLRSDVVVWKDGFDLLALLNALLKLDQCDVDQTHKHGKPNEEQEEEPEQQKAIAKDD